MRDVSRWEKRPAFFLEGKCLGKLLGFFVSRLTLDPSTQLATVCAWLAAAAEAAIAALRWSRGAPSMAALLFSHSTVCCRIQNCKRKKKEKVR